MTYTPAQLQTRFDALPDELQDYILSNEVAEEGHNLAEWFEIKNVDALAEGIFALLVGAMSTDEFITFSQEKFGLDEEAADTLAGEIGDRILTEAYQIFDDATEEASVAENGSLSTPSQPPKPIPPLARATGDVRQFVGVPAYGVQRPASSYTSVLPRTETDLNKAKNTPTADSFIQKLNKLAPNSTPASAATPTSTPSSNPIPETKTAPAPANLPTGTAASFTVPTQQAAAPQPIPPAAPIMPKPLAPVQPIMPKPVAPQPAIPKPVPPQPVPPKPTPPVLPVLEKEMPSIELAKLARPLSMPQKEIKLGADNTTPPPPQQQKNSTTPNKPYTLGKDPYRESPDA